MELTDSQISYFVDNRLRLPKGKRTEYLAQVERLIEKFAAAAKGDDVIGVKKFLKTGSLRKGTVLRPKGDFGVDADVAVFLNTNGASKFDLANLHDRIRKLLAKTYPTKKPAQSHHEDKVAVNTIIQKVVRAEYYNDSDGFTTAVAQKLWGFTFTADTKLGADNSFAKLLLRPEIRYDKSDENFFSRESSFRSRDYQFTVGIGVVAYF